MTLTRDRFHSVALFVVALIALLHLLPSAPLAADRAGAKKSGSLPDTKSKSKPGVLCIDPLDAVDIEGFHAACRCNGGEILSGEILKGAIAEFKATGLVSPCKRKDEILWFSKDEAGRVTFSVTGIPAWLTIDTKQLTAAAKEISDKHIGTDSLDGLWKEYFVPLMTGKDPRKLDDVIRWSRAGEPRINFLFSAALTHPGVLGRRDHRKAVELMQQSVTVYENLPRFNLSLTEFGIPAGVNWSDETSGYELDNCYKFLTNRFSDGFINDKTCEYTGFYIQLRMIYEAGQRLGAKGVKTAEKFVTNASLKETYNTHLRNADFITVAVRKQQCVQRYALREQQGREAAALRQQREREAAALRQRQEESADEDAERKSQDGWSSFFEKSLQGMQQLQQRQSQFDRELQEKKRQDYERMRALNEEYERKQAAERQRRDAEQRREAAQRREAEQRRQDAIRAQQQNQAAESGAGSSQACPSASGPSDIAGNRASCECYGGTFRTHTIAGLPGWSCQFATTAKGCSLNRDGRWSCTAK